MAGGRHLCPAREGPAEPSRGLDMPTTRSRASVPARARLDAIDGTPIIDIKPFISQFAPQVQSVNRNVRQPKWADELMSDYF